MGKINHWNTINSNSYLARDIGTFKAPLKASTI